MIPLQGFATETGNRVDCEHQQGDYLLDDLQLKQRERTSVTTKSVVIGRYHKAILHKSQAPRDEDDYVQRSVAVQNVHILQFQVPIPCKSHEDIGHYE